MRTQAFIISYVTVVKIVSIIVFSKNFELASFQRKL